MKRTPPVRAPCALDRGTGLRLHMGLRHAMTTMVEEHSPLEEFLFDLQIPCRPTVCERSTGCTTETGKPADQNRSKVSSGSVLPW